MQKLEGTFSDNSENLRDSEFASPEQIDIHFVERASAGDQSPARHANEVNFSKDEEIPPCRICLMNEMVDTDDPLINPCKCKGT